MKLFIHLMLAVDPKLRYHTISKVVGHSVSHFKEERLHWFMNHLIQSRNYQNTGDVTALT